jgi:O-antigen/teichoic acid export membrane protein
LTNAGFNLAGHVAALALAFYLSPILVEGLGDRRYGLWALIESVLAYLLLLEGGIGATLVRYVAKHEALKDREGLRRIYSTTLALMAGAGALAFIVVLGLALGAARPLGISPDLAREARWLLLLLGGNLALMLPLGVYPSILAGLACYPTKVTVRVLGGLLSAISLTALFHTGRGNLVLVGVIVTAVNLGQHLAQAILVSRYLPHLRFSTAAVDAATVRQVRGYTLSAFVVMIAARVSFQTDSLVIGTFVSLEAITYFALASKLVEYSKAFIRSAFGAFTPSISRWEALGQTDAIRRAFLDGSRATYLLIVPVQLGFWFLGRPFLDLWIGSTRAAKTFPVLVILAVPLGLALGQAVASRILYGMERLKGYAATTVAEAVFNLLLSVVLVAPFGIAGVAWGTALPSAVCAAVVILSVCRLLMVSPREYVRQACVLPCILALVPAVIWYGVSQVVVPDSWPRLIVAGAVGMIPYAIAVLLAEPTLAPARAFLKEMGPRLRRVRSATFDLRQVLTGKSTS